MREVAAAQGNEPDDDALAEILQTMPLPAARQLAQSYL
jgi:hypothetical protein